jgi:hypothetical protein
MGIPILRYISIDAVLRQEEIKAGACRTPHYKSFSEFARDKRKNMVVHNLKQII